MFQQFFTKTIESKFIKQLLYYTSLPTYKVITYDSYIFVNQIYVLDNQIIKCTGTGFVSSENYVVLSNYTFGKYYPTFTEKHVSEYGYYDSETHEYLGKYLRCLNSFYGLNLLPFYNCFSGRYASNFYIDKKYMPRTYNVVGEFNQIIPDKTLWKLNKSTGLYTIQLAVEELEYSPEHYSAKFDFEVDSYQIEKTFIIINSYNPLEIESIAVISYSFWETTDFSMYTLVNEPNTKFKVAQIPIEFNKKYTIALDSDSEVLIQPAIIKNNKFVYVYDTNKNKIDLTEELNKRTISKSFTIFKQPFIYEINLDESFDYAEFFEHNERNLYLLIQLPLNVNTSITVLEGDYTKYAFCEKYYDASIIEDADAATLNKLLLSGLSLLKINNKVSYAFSDRLLEYLVNNVITHLDENGENIRRAQKGLGLTSSYGALGVWNNFIRSDAFKFMMEDKTIEHYDFNGFIDKETEKMLIKDIE